MTTDFSLFTLATRNLRRKPLRTWILIIAIALLVSALVFVLSFVTRVNESIKLTSDRLGADILIVPAGSRGSAEDVLLENKVKTFYMDKGLIEKVKKIKGISNLTYQTYLASLTGLCCDVPETVIVAFDQKTDFVIKPWLIKALNRPLQKGEAIVGSESSFNIRVGLTEVESVLFGNLFKMVGVLDKTGTGLDNAIFIDNENISDIIKKGKTDLKPGQISIMFARVQKGTDIDKVANEIEDTIIEVDAVKRKDIGKSVVSALKDFTRIFSMTVVLVSILSAFLAWAVFSAIANERTKEVGIMRALGAKESQVVRLFLLEVMVVGAAGSVLGIIFGTGTAFALGKSFSILKSLSTDLTLLHRLLIAFAGFVIGVTVCVVGALAPIQRIKKLEPLVVIKED